MRPDNRIDFGKMPPQAIDMEEAVLAALMIDKDAILSVPFLKPESFYKESHGLIFRAIYDLTIKNVPADLFSVTEELRKRNEIEAVGGIVFITQLTSRIVSAANIEYHAKIVQQKYIQRELIRIGSDLVNKAFNDANDVHDLFNFAESELLRISGQVQKKEPIKLGKLIDTVIDKIAKIISHEIKLIGVPSGFTAFDRKTGGFKDGDLIIFAARPSMGKTAIALEISLNAAELGYPVAFFSLEMADESLAQRAISGASGKTNVQLMEGNCDIDTICKQTANLTKIPVFIDDTGGISLIELRSKVRRLVLRESIKVVVVDYLQLMRGDKDNREQEVASISRGLKGIAKEFSIPVIALSQLSRKCEERGDKRPMLSDLRESGAIEQDADMVVFLYRPAVYGIQDIEIEKTTVSSVGIMEWIIAKNRQGAIGSTYLSHNTALTDFREYESGFGNIGQSFDEPGF